VLTSDCPPHHRVSYKYRPGIAELLRCFSRLLGQRISYADSAISTTPYARFGDAVAGWLRLDVTETGSAARRFRPPKEVVKPAQATASCRCGRLRSSTPGRGLRAFGCTRVVDVDPELAAVPANSLLKASASSGVVIEEHFSYPGQDRSEGV